jgi:hypothetical protein
MTETKTIGSMTDRQRRALSARLNGDVAEAETYDSFAMAGAGWAAR